MPEGHTIHRIAQDHRKRFLSQPLSVSSPQGRFEMEAEALDGTKIDEIDAYGKHLFYHWEEGQVLHVHLGLYGKFRNRRVPPPEPKGAVRLRVIGAKHAFDLNGPAACDLVSDDEKATILDRLGADPLRKDADVDRLWQRVSRSRASIGRLLLDQSVFAGVGNVYRAEALFALRMSPHRIGKDISREEFDVMWDWLKKHLRVGVRYNRIITVDLNDAGKPPSRLTKHERLLCYKMPHCADCGGEIDVWQFGARTMYACLNCQK